MVVVVRAVGGRDRRCGVAVCPLCSTNRWVDAGEE